MVAVLAYRLSKVIRALVVKAHVRGDQAFAESGFSARVIDADTVVETVRAIARDRIKREAYLAATADCPRCAEQARRNNGYGPAHFSSNQAHGLHCSCDGCF